MKVILIPIFMICFMCHVVLAQDNNQIAEVIEVEEITEEQIIEEYENLEIDSLQSGMKFDEKTLQKIIRCRRYAELANLQSININLAIQKNNDEYNNVFKIWLALHGVVEEDFGLWEISGSRAVLKEKVK